MIQQIVAESAKWTAACGVQIVYDGETEAVPQTLAGGPDGISVVGWQEPDMGISGADYVWYQYGSNGMTLVESDMMLDPRYVTTFDQMTRTVSHEWGHAIGLGHSNVEGALMSGPPDSMYTNGTALTADDIHGCRCLYGPPAGQQAGNVCSLPAVIDFGTLAVGPTSSEKAGHCDQQRQRRFGDVRYSTGQWRVPRRYQRMLAGKFARPGCELHFRFAGAPCQRR